MLRFAKFHVTILPVHDSFICHWKYQQELGDVMSDVFDTPFGVKTWIKLNEKTYVKVSIKQPGEIFEGIRFDSIIGEGNPYLDVIMRSHWKPWDA